MIYWLRFYLLIVIIRPKEEERWRGYLGLVRSNEVNWVIAPAKSQRKELRNSGDFPRNWWWKSKEEGFTTNRWDVGFLKSTWVVNPPPRSLFFLCEGGLGLVIWAGIFTFIVSLPIGIKHCWLCLQVCLNWQFNLILPALAWTWKLGRGWSACTFKIVDLTELTLFGSNPTLHVIRSGRPRQNLIGEFRTIGFSPIPRSNFSSQAGGFSWPTFFSSCLTW